MHEHVVTDYTPPAQRGRKPVEITLENHFELSYHWVDHPGMRDLSDSRRCSARDDLHGRERRAVRRRRQHPRDGPLPGRLREVSKRSGAHIIMGCGRYYDDEGFFDERERARSVDELAREFIDEICVGIDSTSVKAGIIGEIGCSCPWLESEQRSIAAAVVAQRETGATLTIHPGRGDPEAPFQIVEFIRHAGADLSRTIMDHNERRLRDVDAALRLAGTGVVLEFDMFGQETSYFAATGKPFDHSGDSARLTWMRALIDHGHLDQIVISHDICQKPRLQTFGGHGYSHIYRNIIPMMRQRAFSDSEIDAILVRTPKRLLTFA